MLDPKQSNRIINLFNFTILDNFRNSLKVEIPIGIWHTLNHEILQVKMRRIQRYNPKYNMYNLKGILAFLITLYEYDEFTKILVSTGIPEASEEAQIKLYSRFSKYYIIRWLPGMLSSRYIMSRDFVRATPAKSSVVRYNLKYMKSTVYKLYNIPDLLILTSMNGMGAIIAKEAVIMKVPTIGLASNQSFPEKIAFRFFGDVRDLRFIRSFLCIIGLGMRIGGELAVTNNFLQNKSYREEMSNKSFDISEEPVITSDKLNINNFNYNLEFKSKVLNSSFEDFSFSTLFFGKSKLHRFKKFYNRLNLNLFKSSQDRSNILFKFKTKSLKKSLLHMALRNLPKFHKKVEPWFRKRAKRIKRKQKQNHFLSPDPSNDLTEINDQELEMV